jgi:hypothetical protein
MDANRCVCCDAIIPEGGMTCPMCEARFNVQEDDNTLMDKLVYILYKNEEGDINV